MCRGPPVELQAPQKRTAQQQLPRQRPRHELRQAGEARVEPQGAQVALRPVVARAEQPQDHGLQQSPSAILLPLPLPSRLLPLLLPRGSPSQRRGLPQPLPPGGFGEQRVEERQRVGLQLQRLLARLRQLLLEQVH